MAVMVRTDRITGYVDSCHVCAGCEVRAPMSPGDKPPLPAGWEDRVVHARTPTGLYTRRTIWSHLSLCPTCKLRKGDVRFPMVLNDDDLRYYEELARGALPVSLMVSLGRSTPGVLLSDVECHCEPRIKSGRAMLVFEVYATLNGRKCYGRHACAAFLKTDNNEQALVDFLVESVLKDYDKVIVSGA